MVVAAAGNYGRLSLNGSNGYGTVAAPGNDPLVITVGAMKAMGSYSRTDDQIASYSSKGPTTYDHVVKPDVVAPGNLVVSTDSRGSTLETLFPNNAVAGNTSQHDYLSLSGTSMATPAVAGGVALMLQQNPNLTPDQVKARLMKTAYKTFPMYSIATDPATGLTYLSYYDVFHGRCRVRRSGSSVNQHRPGACERRCGSVSYGHLQQPDGDGDGIEWQRHRCLVFRGMGLIGRVGLIRGLGREPIGQFGGVGQFGCLGQQHRDRIQRRMGIVDGHGEQRGVGRFVGLQRGIFRD
ncbi:MAG: S8 family serine peptidase [Acidobacteriia bacterium]|nr:S8 family serine peptidase [Terriglobia bacterium]